MQGILQYELLIFEGNAIVLVVDQFTHVLPVFDFIFFEGCFQRGEMGGMLSHIGCKDEASGTLSEDFKLLARETFQEIVFILVKNPEKLCCMERFLNGGVIRINSPLCDRIYVITISKAVMSQIMTNGCNNHAQTIQLTELQNTSEFTRRKLIKCELHDISPVQMIVILYIVNINMIYPVQELPKLLVADHFIQAEIIDAFKRHQWQSKFASELFRDLPDVK